MFQNKGHSPVIDLAPLLTKMWCEVYTNVIVVDHSKLCDHHVIYVSVYKGNSGREP